MLSETLDEKNKANGISFDQSIIVIFNGHLINILNIVSSKISKLQN